MTLVLLAGLLAAVAPKASDENVTAWFEMNPYDFGCYLERTFGARDKKWGCTSPVHDIADDPCGDPERYRAGPQFAAKTVKKVHAKLENITLGWEHGELQTVTLAFAGIETDEAARAMFRLPREKKTPTFASVSLQECGKKKSCLVIQKFDRADVADANCAQHPSGD
ncbi:MAG: hypothetical protein HY903_05795 [Deltaproteobacteria bacterium]|nr:hypothetical protein [Deltaproteobacteria bacterium]